MHWAVYKFSIFATFVVCNVHWSRSVMVWGRVGSGGLVCEIVLLCSFITSGVALSVFVSYLESG